MNHCWNRIRTKLQPIGPLMDAFCCSPASIRRAALKPLRQRLTLQELDGEKINLPTASGDGMDLEYSANTGVPDFAGVTHFSGQPPAETGLGTLNGNTTAQFFIHGFVN